MSVRGRATILACALAFASTVIGCLLAPSQALATTPLAPTGLLAAPGPADPLVATLVWTPPLDPTVTGYRVRIATHAAGPWTLLGTTSAATYVFDTGFGSIPYRYRVSAVDADGHESVPAEDTPPPPAWFTPVHEGMASAVTLCRKCHRAHSAESGRILRADVAPLCWECHDGQLAGAADIRGGADSFAAASGHVLGAASGPRLLTATCTGCHGAHQPIAADPMLPAAEVNGVAVAGAGPAWCLACHDAAGSWAGGGYPSTAAPSRDASGYPVSGTWPGPAAWAGSADGHAGIPEATQTADGGRQVRRPVGDCLYCHAAHRGPNRYDALLATFTPPAASTLSSDQADGAYASLCFTCHGGAPASGFTTAPADIRSFATTTALDTTSGHRVITSGGVLPQGAPLPCYECHNPHGSARGNGRLISDALGAGLMTTSTPTAVRRFCFTCHTTSDTAEGWDSETSAYYAVEASETVVGLRRDGGPAAPYNALRLPSLSGHNVGDAGTCYSCHGNDYSPGGSNVHRPGAGGFDPLLHTAELGDASIVGTYTPKAKPVGYRYPPVSDGFYPGGDAFTSGIVSVTPASPATMWDKVDDDPTADTTTYVTLGSITTTSVALFSYGDFAIPAGSTITNVTVYYRHAKAASTGAATSQATIRVGGVDYYATTQASSATWTTWTTSNRVWATNPKTGLAWTVDEITDKSGANSLQAFGVRGLKNTQSVRVTQTFVIVNYSMNPTVTYDIRCDVCHNMRIDIEHDKATASSVGAGCDNCHPTPRDSFASWTKTCTQGGCHPPASGTQTHHAISTVHTVTVDPLGCTSVCHYADVPGEHRKAILVHQVDSPDEYRWHDVTCEQCHTTAVAALAAPWPGDCTTCHPTYHVNSAAAHLTPNLAGGYSPGFDNSRTCPRPVGGVPGGGHCSNPICHHAGDPAALASDVAVVHAGNGCSNESICHSAAFGAVNMPGSEMISDCGMCHYSQNGTY